MHSRSRSDQASLDTQIARLGESIKRRRMEARLSQQALARVSCISQGEISAIEAGKRDVRIKTLVSLARALDTDPAELVALLE